MKRMMLLVIMTMTAAFATAANNRPEGENNRNKREELQKSVMTIIRAELSLDDKQFEAFVPIYGEYREALRGNEKRGERINPANATDEQMLEMLNKSLDHQIHIATVRKEYIAKFSAVLNTRQIAELYRIDNMLAKRAFEQLNKRGGDFSRRGHCPTHKHNGHHHRHNCTTAE